MNIKQATFKFSDFNFIYGQPASGKSAVFEAIAICLSDMKRTSTYGSYVMQGKSSASIQMEAIINGFPASFDCTLHRIDGVPFEVNLQYQGMLYKNTKASDLLKSFNLDYYLKTAFAMQHDEDIVGVSPSWRLYLMQKLFNLSFEDEKSKLKQLQSVVRDELLKNDSETIALKAMQDKNKAQTYDEALAKTLSEDELQKLSSEIASLEKKISDSAAAQKQLLYMKDTLAQKKLEAQQLKSKLSSVEALKAEQQELAQTLDKLAASLKELDAKLASAQDEAASLSKESEALAQEKHSNSVERSTNGVKMKFVLDKLDLIGKGICPTCGQKTDHLDESAKDDYEALKLEASAIAAKAEEISSKKDGIDKKLQESKKQLNTLSSERSTVAYRQKATEEKIQKNKEALSIDTSLICSKAEECETEIASLTDQIASVAVEDTQQFYSKAASLRSKLSDDKAARERNALILKAREQRLQQSKDIEERLAKIEESCNELKRLQLSYEEANVILTKSLPTYVSEKIYDALQKDLNFFIQKIFPSYVLKIEPSKKGCEFFYTRDSSLSDDRLNKWLNAQMSSGFERSMLNIAFKVTLSKMYGIDIFIGDEIDKAASDEDSVKMISLINSLGVFNQTFIISHNQGLKNVILEEGNATVYEANEGSFVEANQQSA